MRLFLGTDYDETTCLNGFKIQKSRFKGFKSDEIRMAYVSYCSLNSSATYTTRSNLSAVTYDVITTAAIRSWLCYTNSVLLEVIIRHIF